MARTILVNDTLAIQLSCGQFLTICSMYFRIRSRINFLFFTDSMSLTETNVPLHKMDCFKTHN